jgi:dTDP-4-dehydrorhamnose 3,5-epimerase
VRCSYGAIFDVIVDLRPGSPTYRNWESFELRDAEQISLYAPARQPVGTFAYSCH